jgi:GNAT superfamily N-acetyltransferase
LQISISECPTSDYCELGELTVAVYSGLANMPSRDVMPEYYQLLRDTQSRAESPTTKIFAAYDESNQLLGGVTFIGDMAFYGSGGSATTIKNSAGFRLLAVAPEAQGLGVGKALSVYCIGQARELNVEQIIIHSTHAMQVAWKMYEKLGFEPFPEIDFDQSGLAVFGFRKRLAGTKG